jgi:hypothetical protein
MVLRLSGAARRIGRVRAWFANMLGLRTIGIAGYTIVFGLTCLPLNQTFLESPRSRGGTI